MKMLSSDMGKLSTGITTLDDALSRASQGISNLIRAQKGETSRKMVSERYKARLTHVDQHLSAVHDWLSPLFHSFNSIQHETFNKVARQDGMGLRLMKSAQYKQW